MNRVMIYLTSGKQQLEYASGEKRLIEFKAGDTLWSPATGVHTSQNMGSPFRVIEVELNNKPGPAAAPLELDPVKVAPANYKVVIDEPQVRVIRARMGPRQQVPMHEHPAKRVTVFVTDAHLRVTDSAGATSELKAEAGTARWSGPARHREENLSDKPFEVIAVELK
jgi:quercetin dioxygenase-like cupin family protein